MRVQEIQELRTPSALRMLELWRETRQCAEDPLERGLLCNAAILAESCFSEGERCFPDGEAVLHALTAREMEELLRRLGAMPEEEVREENPAFDPRRFAELEGI